MTTIMQMGAHVIVIPDSLAIIAKMHSLSRHPRPHRAALQLVVHLFLLPWHQAATNTTPIN